jgi:hypothetical protein
VVAEQALNNGEVVGRDVDGRPEGTVAVVVHGLEDRLAVSEVEQVLPHDVDVVALRVERRDVELGPLLAVVAVIVVRADVRHLLGAKDAYETSGDRCLACRRITDDAKNDWSRHAFLLLRIPRLILVRAHVCASSTADS